jgi:hypothetical protein
MLCQLDGLERSSFPPPRPERQAPTLPYPFGPIPEPEHHSCAVLVAVQIRGVSMAELAASLGEPEHLASALGLCFVARITQRWPGSGAASLLGEGKLREPTEWTHGAWPRVQSFPPSTPGRVTIHGSMPGSTRTRIAPGRELGGQHVGLEPGPGVADRELVCLGSCPGSLRARAQRAKTYTTRRRRRRRLHGNLLRCPVHRLPLDLGREAAGWLGHGVLRVLMDAP